MPYFKANGANQFSPLLLLLLISKRTLLFDVALSKALGAKQIAARTHLYASSISPCASDILLLGGKSRGSQKLSDPYRLSMTE